MEIQENYYIEKINFISHITEIQNFTEKQVSLLFFL